MTISESFEKLFTSLTDDDKKAITNHMFNNGLPEDGNFDKSPDFQYPSLFHPPKGQRYGQNFLNRLPIKIGPDEPDANFDKSSDFQYSEIFYAPDSLEIKLEIQQFQVMIFNDPVQEQVDVKIPEGFIDE
jgi:hypothetical protein